MRERDTQLIFCYENITESMTCKWSINWEWDREETERETDRQIRDRLSLWKRDRDRQAEILCVSDRDRQAEILIVRERDSERGREQNTYIYIYINTLNEYICMYPFYQSPSLSLTLSFSLQLFLSSAEYRFQIQQDWNLVSQKVAIIDCDYLNV